MLGYEVPVNLIFIMTTQLIDFLSEFVSERRLALIDKVIETRTNYVTVLLEDISHAQNANAVLRTCECMGLQDIHIIENMNQYYYSKGVAMGAGKWVNFHKYNKYENNSLEAVMSLKAAGYRIVATVPGENCISLNDFDIGKGKFAIVLGTEQEGISETIRKNADELITIPMYGFTESFNLSVSNAIILHHLVEKIRCSDISWQLSDNEKIELKLNWLKSMIKKSELLVRKYEEMHVSCEHNVIFQQCDGIRLNTNSISI
jgi:tRNA (guanosine-2'-O-)-methyltransferase